MKKAAIILALAVLAAGFSFAAEKAAKADSARSDFAILFDLKSLLLVADSFEDGYQAGAGLKWWPMDALAVRGLLRLEHNSLEDISETMFGFSAGAEWHPRVGRVSPYVGGFLGIRTLAMTDEETALDYYFGAMGGAEMVLWQNISLYAEYELVASNDIDGFTLRFGGPDCVQVGLALYF